MINEKPRDAETQEICELTFPLKSVLMYAQLINLRQGFRLRQETRPVRPTPTSFRRKVKQEGEKVVVAY